MRLKKLSILESMLLSEAIKILRHNHATCRCFMLTEVHAHLSVTHALQVHGRAAADADDRDVLPAGGALDVLPQLGRQPDHLQLHER